MLKSDSSEPKKRTRKSTASPAAGPARKKTAGSEPARPKKAAGTAAVVAPAREPRREFVGEPSREEIAQRAYELYEARGRTNGRADADWILAEQQLRAERRRGGEA